MAKDRRQNGKRDGSRVYAPTHGDRERPRYDSVHRLEPMDRDALRGAAMRQLGREAPPAPEEDKPPRAEQAAPSKSPRKQASRARKALGWLIALVVVAALGLAGWFLLLIDTVEIEGNERYSDESIRSLTGLTAGQHMLFADFGAVREGIEGSPYLRVEGIERVWPNTIRITVAERAEAAVIETLDTDVIIDITGHVLSFGSSSDLSHLVRVTGVPLTGYQVNQSIASGADFQTEALLMLLDALLEYGLLEKVALADISNPLRASLMTRSGIQVVLGQPTELSEKLGWMRDALLSLEMSGIAEGTLDVSAKGGAVWSPAIEEPDLAPANPETLGDLENPENPEDPEGAAPEDGESPESGEPETPEDSGDSGGDGGNWTE